MRRRRRVIRCITRLLVNRDFLLLQETHYAALEDKDLEQAFPNCVIYRSNMKLGRGGTAIMVKKKLAQNYSIVQIPLPEAAKGRVLALSFTSVDKPKDTKKNSKPEGYLVIFSGLHFSLVFGPVLRAGIVAQSRRAALPLGSVF
jgi:hypothetical protein